MFYEAIGTRMACGYAGTLHTHLFAVNAEASCIFAPPIAPNVSWRHVPTCNVGVKPTGDPHTIQSPLTDAYFGPLTEVADTYNQVFVPLIVLWETNYSINTPRIKGARFFTAGFKVRG